MAQKQGAAGHFTWPGGDTSSADVFSGEMAHEIMSSRFPQM